MSEHLRRRRFPPGLGTPDAGGPHLTLRGFDARHLPALDGVRAIAVIMVIVYHSGADWIGGTGVTVFFVLSGFLITWLLLKENRQRGRIDVRAFYRRRALRIFPAFYAFCVLFIGALLLTSRPVPWGHAVSAALYVSNYYNAIFGDPNTGFSHTWSLAIEEQFYLLWPTLFLLLASLRAPRTSRTRVLAAVVVCVWLYRVLLVEVFEVDQAYLYAAFDTRMDALLCGCLLAVAVWDGSAPGLARWTRAWWQPLLTLGALVALHAGDTLGIPRYRDVILFAAGPPLIGLLLAQLIAQAGSPVWSWLDWRPLAYLGRISYGMYLYQQIVVHPVQRLLPEFPMLGQVVVVIAITTMLASASYFVIELPFLRLKHGGTASAPATSGDR